MSLQIYIGPMYAGKTSKMIQMFNSNSCEDKIAIDFELNNTDIKLDINVLENHNHIELNKCYKTTKLEYLYDESCYERLSQTYFTKCMTTKHIYINECQFFPDLKSHVIQWLNEDKNVYLYGLDADFKMELFGQTAMLIPYCSYIEKLTGICQICNNSSIVSHRISLDTQVFLPNAESYIPLCLKCKKES